MKDASKDGPIVYKTYMVDGKEIVCDGGAYVKPEDEEEEEEEKEEEEKKEEEKPEDELTDAEKAAIGGAVAVATLPALAVTAVYFLGNFGFSLSLLGSGVGSIFVFNGQGCLWLNELAGLLNQAAFFGTCSPIALPI